MRYHYFRRSELVPDKFFVKFGVRAVFGEQSAVCPLLHDLPLFQNEDPMRVTNGGKAVGDDKTGASLEKPFQGVLDDTLGLRINCARGFVEYEDSRACHQRASKTNQLPLSGAEV